MGQTTRGMFQAKLQAQFYPRHGDTDFSIRVSAVSSGILAGRAGRSVERVCCGAIRAYTVLARDMDSGEDEDGSPQRQRRQKKRSNSFVGRCSKAQQATSAWPGW